ncbi:ParB N-terminal domain-containing protein [candidate division KSB1 bacterium]|nr:ParB N-terminal domain-containing protein [candidate division KSB1 bacterium]
MEREYHLLDRQKLDCRDLLFYIYDPLPRLELEQSIRMYGLHQPLVVRSKGSAFQIVSGFRRAEVAAELSLDVLPCFVVDETDDWRLFLYALTDNLTFRSFNPMEISAVLEKSLKIFQRSTRQVLDDVAPRLGLGRNPRIFELYHPLQSLDSLWHVGTANGTLSVETAVQIAALDSATQQALFPIYDTLRPGKNLQRELQQLLQDCAKIAGTSLIELTEDEELQRLLTAGDFTSAQRLERFRQALWCRRYPRYSRTLEKLAAILKEAKLPPGMQIRETPFFERDIYSVHFQFRTEQEFDVAFAILQEMRKNHLIKRLEELHG